MSQADPNTSQRVDVVIVGAGLAGLCAARELVRRGKTCVVLEARDRVGGRTLSQSLGGDVIDLGGQWIGPTQNRLAGLVAELGIKRFPQHHDGKKLLSWGGTLQEYTGDLPRLPILAQLELARADWQFKRFVRQIPPEAPWSAPRAEEWDSMSLETWKRRHLRTGGARLFLDTVTRAVLTSEPRDVSFLFFLSYLRWGNGLQILTSIEGGAQQERFIGGAQQISQKLADQLAPRVVLSAPVREIEQDANGVSVRRDGRAYQAQRVIVAVPPLLAGRIHYTAALPARRDQLTARMPMGSVIKYVAAYERPFWRQAGFSGEAFSDTGITVTTFDDSSHDGRQPALVTFSDGGGRPPVVAPHAGGTTAGGAERARSLLRPAGCPPGGVRGKGLERRPLERRLLCRRRWARHAHVVRRSPAGTMRSHPLVRHRDRHGVDGLSGRGDPIRAAGRRGSGRAAHLAGSRTQAMLPAFSRQTTRMDRARLALLTFPPRLATSPRTRATSQSQRPHRFPTCKTRRAHG